MDLKQYVFNKASEAKEASMEARRLTSEAKNSILLKTAEEFNRRTNEIISNNQKDIDAASSRGLSKAMIDRLRLTENRIKEMAEGLIQVAKLPDPTGEVLKMWQRPNGMTVGKMRVPIGVIGIIYESRPNVTAEAASLCFKAGNAVMLRGGSEALHSNKIIVEIMRDVFKEMKAPEGIITYLDVTDREAVNEMLKLDSLIDLIIPRGGEGLIKAVVENSRIPVLKHYKGVCHVYVDNDADLAMAQNICINAKVQRPGTCNAMETMLVHKDIAPTFLKDVSKAFKEAGVVLKGCEESRKIIPEMESVTEDDYYREYLDLVLNVKIVADMQDAIAHISKFSSAHSDAIVTKDYGKAMVFLREVDSSAVFVNASTRLNDGFQFGLGAEIGISTDKIHARGPMGLEELTSTKYIVLGNGQIRQ